MRTCDKEQVKELDRYGYKDRFSRSLLRTQVVNPNYPVDLENQKSYTLNPKH